MRVLRAGPHASGKRGVAGQPVYRRWIEIYSGHEFAELAAWLRAFVDRAALAEGGLERTRMEQAFLTSSRYEYMFWDATYRMED